MTNIMVTAASRRVALIKLLKDALKKEGKKGNIIATDINPLSAALNFCDKRYIVPESAEDGYMEIIHTICIKENVTLIIPTIDEEIQPFSEHKAMFQDSGITVLAAEPHSANICFDKYRSFQFFRKNNIDTPHTFLPSQINFTSSRYPLFIKPRFGKGSEQTFIIKNEKELRFFLKYITDPIVQHFIRGREFTIDVLSDLDGNVISVVPRERLAIRSGVSDRGCTVKDYRLIAIGEKIAFILKLIGPSNIQCIIDDKTDTINIIEINPRFSGAIQLTEKAGGNFFRNIIKMANKEKIEPSIGDFTEGIIMVNYESSIYTSDGHNLRFFADPEHQ